MKTKNVFFKYGLVAQKDQLEISDCLQYKDWSGNEQEVRIIDDLMINSPKGNALREAPVYGIYYCLGNGEKWFAEIRDQIFYHYKFNGKFSHTDTIIHFISWNGKEYQASVDDKVELRFFAHKEIDGKADFHSNTLTYLDWEGNPCKLKAVKGKLFKAKDETESQYEITETIYYKAPDGTNGSTILIGEKMYNFKDGDPEKCQMDESMTYMNWEGKAYASSTLIKSGNQLFSHTSQMSNEVIEDSYTLDYLNWGNLQCSLRIINGRMTEKTVNAEGKEWETEVDRFNYLSANNAKWMTTFKYGCFYHYDGGDLEKFHKDSIIVYKNWNDQLITSNVQKIELVE